MTTKKGLMIGALVLAIAMAASAAYAGSALQLYTNCGVDYIKHVNFVTPTSATTALLLKKVNGDGTVQIKISARATDGSTLTQYRTIGLRCDETRTVSFVWSKPITDLNFIQLIANDVRK